MGDSNPHALAGYKSQVSSLSENAVEKLDLVFYSEAERAVSRVLEI